MPGIELGGALPDARGLDQLELEAVRLVARQFAGKVGYAYPLKDFAIPDYDYDAILTDVAFGVVSRVVPQLNIFAVGFPVKIIVGLLIVAAALPFMGTWFYDQLQGSVETGLSGIGVG